MNLPLDPKVRGLCEKLVRWWHTDDPDRRLGMESAHDLSGIVFLAQMLLDADDRWIASQARLPLGTPNSHES